MGRARENRDSRVASPAGNSRFGPVSLCVSLQLNSLGADACKEIRDLLLHDKCAVTDLR